MKEQNAGQTITNDDEFLALNGYQKMQVLAMLTLAQKISLEPQPSKYLSGLFGRMVPILEEAVKKGKKTKCNNRQ